jgi:hypothetical protein
MINKNVYNLACAYKQKCLYLSQVKQTGGGGEAERVQAVA